MPRYHFDLVDRNTFADERGNELSDDIEAMDVAQEIAKRLRVQRPQIRGRHYSIIVTNEDGEEIGRVPLDILH